LWYPVSASSLLSAFTLPGSDWLLVDGWNSSVLSVGRLDVSLSWCCFIDVDEQGFSVGLVCFSACAEEQGPSMGLACAVAVEVQGPSALGLVCSFDVEVGLACSVDVDVQGPSMGFVCCSSSLSSSSEEISSLEKHSF